MPLTPVYVFTLSKALMLTSIVDAVAVDALGGVLVYAGGDDVYALTPDSAPPVRLDQQRYVNPVFAALLGAYVSLYGSHASLDYVRLLVEKLGLVGSRELGSWSIYVGGEVDVALLTVLATRLNYWGVLDSYAHGSLHPGFHILPTAAVAATIAYGRSYGVRYAHYREPLWLVYASSSRAEEEKDNVSVVCTRGSRRHEKDVAIATRGAGHYTLSNISCDGCRSIDLLVLRSPLYHAIALITRIPALLSRAAPHKAIEVDGLLGNIGVQDPHAAALQYAEVVTRSCRRCQKWRLAILFEEDASMQNMMHGRLHDTQLSSIFHVLALKV